MKTTLPTLATLPIAGALLMLPTLLQADLLTPSRMTPLASDYLSGPNDDASAGTPAADGSDAPVTTLPPVVVNVSPVGAHDNVPAPSRAEMAERRYFTGATDTLNRYTLPLFGRDRQTIALERLQEDERLADLNALDEQITLIAADNSAEAKQLRELLNAAYVSTRPF